MSLKARYSPRPDLELELEGASVKDLFGVLATVAEIFSEPNCGACGCQVILPLVRKSKDKKGKEHTYYEYKCTKCNARLAYGQSLDKENLFPKRKVADADGNEVYDTKNRGWARWKPDAD
jgi:hypothetical protein